MAGVSGRQTRRIGSIVWALVGARPRVIRKWRERQVLGLAELYRRRFWRDSGSWGLGGERQERIERKAVLVGNWSQAVGNGRLELRD